MESERRSSKPDVARSSRAEAFLQLRISNYELRIKDTPIFVIRNLKFVIEPFRGRLTAGRIALNDETRVRILSPKPAIKLNKFKVKTRNS